MSHDLTRCTPTGLTIGGGLLPSSDGSRISSVDPGTEKGIVEVVGASADDAGPARDASAARARAEVLRNAFQLMTARHEDIESGSRGIN
ncbi:MAG: hypothetical protein ACE5OQ_07045 [Woeseia sp.]